MARCFKLPLDASCHSSACHGLYLLASSLLMLLGASVTIPGRAQSIGTRAYLSGPDTPEQELEAAKLFGNWGGERERLEKRGVSFDLLYISDSLANIRSEQPKRFTSFNRVRGTVDLDLGKLARTAGLSVHLSGVWQTGANLGDYLGMIASPSALSTANAFRLDAWWVEKTVHSGRIAFRAGQFSGLDSYGSQYFGPSFFSQPMGYALTALGNTYVTFQPFATTSTELRVAEFKRTYIKSMVLSGDRLPTQHNLTGFAPQFRGAPVSISEVGWTPGLRASDIKPSSTVDTRRGYSGLYRFGAAYNPGKFKALASNGLSSGNYTIYGVANQALYRLPGKPGTGPDLTTGVSWSPSDRNADNRQVTLGLRYNDVLPLNQHTTLAVGWVHSGISSYVSRFDLLHPNSAENLLELDGTIALKPFIILEPTAQRILDVGGSRKADTLVGFRSKVVF